MIPFEKAVDMLRGLSGDDYESAVNYIAALSAGRCSPETPLTRAQILEDLAISRQQIKEGKYRPAKEAIDGVMAEYGLLHR
ncbi:MAG: hypothetical protein IJH09_06195 [Clostridia bacterium]|nr:hypothetical protein [Clostridia bacterium]